MPWECDLISVTPAGFINEFEIKLSKYDYKADFKKRIKHEALSEALKNPTSLWVRPTYFWYVIFGFQVDVPDYAGLMIADDGHYRIRFEEIKRAPRLSKRLINNKQKETLYRGVYWRFWQKRIDEKGGMEI